MIELSSWFDTSGSASSAAANDTAFTALLAHLTSNPGDRDLVARHGQVIRIGGGTQRVFPANTRLVMEGSSRFESLVTLGSSSSELLRFETGCITHGLHVKCLEGSSFRRLITYVDRNRVYDTLVEAEAQINNEGSSPLTDFAVRYCGQDQKVYGSKVINIDKAHFVYGDGGDGNPMLGARLYRIEVENYVTGLYLRNLRDAKNIGASIKGRSPNATQDPGHNGILHEGVFEYELLDFSVKDAGEHDVRFGGTRNNEQRSGLITVSNGSLYRAGQSALKFFAGIAGQVFDRVNVSNINVVDCQYEPENPSELPGWNDEGFLFQQMRGLIATGLSVTKQSSTTGYSCDCCVVVTTSADVLINGLIGDAPRRNLFRLAEYDDGAGVAPVETTASNGIKLKNAVGTNIHDDGIYIDHPTQSIRDLVVEADLIGADYPGTFAVKVNGSASRFKQPCLIEYKQRNFGSAVSAPWTSDLRFRDRNSSVY